jgi:uncharacterized membrane-anchored protein
MSKGAFWAVLLSLGLAGPALAADEGAADEAGADKAQQEYVQKVRALHWVKGPAQVTVGGNSTLKLPEGYVYLDAANTAKYEELNENFSSGKEVFVAPKDLSWNAYLEFSDDGYVKDDEKIDAPAILKTLTENTEEANEERRRRGWADMHVVGWSIPPAYNADTKRLEWATLLSSRGSEGTNFFTKVLGRRGVTTVVLVSRPQDTTAAVKDLNQVLTGYQFNSGDTYADYKPGDKVAEYGLTGLIVGGAVAAAVKTGVLKGLWKVIAAAGAALWKFLVAAVVAAVAGLKALFKRKSAA